MNNKNNWLHIFLHHIRLHLFIMIVMGGAFAFGLYLGHYLLAMFIFAFVLLPIRMAWKYANLHRDGKLVKAVITSRRPTANMPHGIGINGTVRLLEGVGEFDNAVRYFSVPNQSLFGRYSARNYVPGDTNDEVYVYANKNDEKFVYLDETQFMRNA